MNPLIENIYSHMQRLKLSFKTKPIIIGGSAMEFYGLRKSGSDIDLVINDTDYQELAHNYPDKRKDIYGDLGVILEPFEIWRSIALFDYDFFSKDAIETEYMYIISMEKLLVTRACAIEVPKYYKDLELVVQGLYKKYRNQDFQQEAETHIEAYRWKNGEIWGGQYEN